MTSASPADSLTPTAAHHPEKNNPREIFGWKVYDWANSAFSTTIAGALYGPYLTEITQKAVGENGVVFYLGPVDAITAKSFSHLRFGGSVPADFCSAHSWFNRRLFKS